MLEFMQDELRYEDGAVEKFGLTHVRDPAIDDHARIHEPCVLFRASFKEFFYVCRIELVPFPDTNDNANVAEENTHDLFTAPGNPGTAELGTNVDISSDDLAGGIAAAGKSVEVIENRRAIVDNAGEYKCYVILGARDDTLADLAEEIARKNGSAKV
jgi:hypothetical protein